MWFQKTAPEAVEVALSENDGVRFDRVSVEREGRTVLSDLSLHLTHARIGIVGDNGCGKSTLLRLINGLLLPTHGQVRVLGLETQAMRERLPQHVGFIFQNPDQQLLFPTVEEELAFGLEQWGQTPALARTRAREALCEQGMDDLAERPVHSLSGGQKQRVCILAVLLMQPKILLLDEPFSSLDLRTRHRLQRDLMSLPQQLLMVSHDMALLADFDWILWLHEGRLYRAGSAGEILPAYAKASSEGLAL